MTITASDISTTTDLNQKARPVLKWAGGKTQLIPQLNRVTPIGFGKYIEPFIGGGAYFFHLDPEQAIIGDTNAELISLYKVLATDADKVAEALAAMPISADEFYKIRSQDWEQLCSVEAAARTIYLNRLCFNGLYRVNRRGQFNVPYGNYMNPKMPDYQTLAASGKALSRASIVKGDYIAVLHEHAAPGDFVFLDPPYIPISHYSDFKRYTVEPFHEDDHHKLAAEVHRLSCLGCHVVLTNSNHPLVHELYKDFEIQVVETRRNINSKGSLRRGEDVIVVAVANP
ncbi:MAG: Dam family site-specific DNA-(adenine-N6)-methyltransferase [Ilumatobacteraceae bacterium]